MIFRKSWLTDKRFFTANAQTISERRAFEIINMNRRGEKPDNLLEGGAQQDANRPLPLSGERETIVRLSHCMAHPVMHGIRDIGISVDF